MLHQQYLIDQRKLLNGSLDLFNRGSTHVDFTFHCMPLVQCTIRPNISVSNVFALICRLHHLLDLVH